MGSEGVATTAAWYGALALGSIAILAALWRGGFFPRLLAIAEEMLFSNWQLATLGAAALALSLASGYTTYDGLRNFTSAPLLSVLVAFGIQGVMLIVAWLIGESFATGMARPAPRRRKRSAYEVVVGSGLAMVLAGLIFYCALSRSGAIGLVGGALHADWQRFADVTLYFLMGVAALALLAFQARRGGDVAQPYVQSLRLIARNAALWAMLLAAMSASVFFSFDSHFNAIFPAGQRERAAANRTLNEVAAVVADIGESARKAQAAEARRLLEAEGWTAYDAGLSRLAAAARAAERDMAAALAARMEERQRGVGELQERIAGAERGRAALLRKRDEVEAELQRLEPSVGALEAELAKAQTALDETRQAMTAKRIEAAAEDGGVEGSLKRGKGPAWRQRAAELEELQRKLEIADEPRLKAAQRQRELAAVRIVGLKRELATLAGEVAKYTGAIRTAENRIEAVEAHDGGHRAGGVESTRVLGAFENARSAFRQRPDAERLAALEKQCTALVEALSATPAAGEARRGIRCDPGPAAEAASRLFALNAGLLLFQANCAGGARLPQAAGTDELLAFGRKCLQDSGLASREAGNFGARLQAIEMNRDDKAHRFVVTWNAVLDGNRLAYLALALAVGVDALVFVAGLFGAAAARSPLSDLAGPRARSAARLEAIINSALGKDRAESAELILSAMQPTTGDDHRSEVDLADCDAGRARRIRKVLAAGRSIGAVERVSAAPGDERYSIRPELFEFLSMVASAAHDREHSDQPGMPASLAAAPEPNRRRNAGNESTSSRFAARIVSAPIALPEAHILSASRAIAPPAHVELHEPDMDDLHRHFWDVLLQQMKSEAQAVAEELERRGGASGDIAAVLEWIAKSSRRALARAVRVVESAFDNDGRDKALLDEKRREIDRIVPALMLLPELGLLELLTAEVAKSGDEDLLKRLRSLGEAIEGMLRIDDAASWREIARRIRQLAQP